MFRVLIAKGLFPHGFLLFHWIELPDGHRASALLSCRATGSNYLQTILLDFRASEPIRSRH